MHESSENMVNKEGIESLDELLQELRHILTQLEQSPKIHGTSGDVKLSRGDGYYDGEFDIDGTKKNKDMFEKRSELSKRGFQIISKIKQITKESK
jgi:hypothetical protein